MELAFPPSSEPTPGLVTRVTQPLTLPRILMSDPLAFSVLRQKNKDSYILTVSYHLPIAQL